MTEYMIIYGNPTSTQCCRISDPVQLIFDYKDKLFFFILCPCILLDG